MDFRTSTLRGLIPWIALTILIYLSAFLYTEYFPENRLMVDSSEYFQAAENLLSSGVYYSGDLNGPIDPVLYSRRPPGYPVLLLILKNNPSMIVLFQILLTGIGGYLLWFLLGLMTSSSVVKKSLLFIYFLYPAQVIYSHMIMAEVLLQFLLLTAVFAVAKFWVGRNPGWLLLCNICLGLAILTKPVMIYFWIPNLAFHIWFFARSKKKVVLVYSLLPLLTIVIWSYRNYVVTGYFHYSSIQITQMKIHSRGIGAINERQPDLAKANRESRNAYLQKLVEDWPRTLGIISRGTVAFFLDPGRFDIYEFLNQPHDLSSYKLLYSGPSYLREMLEKIPIPIWIYLLITGILNLVIAAGFIVFIFFRSKSSEVKWYLILMVFYVLGVVVFGAIGTSRYRLSIEPLLIVSLTRLAELLLSLLRRSNRQIS